jgi:hypothetical protein
LVKEKKIVESLDEIIDIFGKNPYKYTILIDSGIDVKPSEIKKPSFLSRLFNRKKAKEYKKLQAYTSLRKAYLVATDIHVGYNFIITDIALVRFYTDNIDSFLRSPIREPHYILPGVAWLEGYKLWSYELERLGFKPVFPFTDYVDYVKRFLERLTINDVKAVVTPTAISKIFDELKMYISVRFPAVVYLLEAERVIIHNK